LFITVEYPRGVSPRNALGSFVINNSGLIVNNYFATDASMASRRSNVHHRAADKTETPINTICE